MESVYHIGIVQALFAAIIIYLKTDKSLADRLLSLWLATIALELTHSFLNFYVFTNLPDLVIFPMAYGPFIYLYTTYLVRPAEKFNNRKLLHFTPLILFLLIPIFWQKPIEVPLRNFFKLGNETTLGIINYTVFLASILFYFPNTLKLISKHKKSISNQFSYENEANTLNWLFIISVVLFIILLLDEILQLIFVLLHINPFNPVLLFHVVTIVFSFSISFYGFRQPNIFAEHKFNREKQNSAKNNSINENEEQIAKTLIQFMETQKPYLNRELTLQEVASELEIPIHLLSKIINSHFKKNFFTFINEYRIEEAKQRMLSEEYKKLTLLAVAFDSGFNSKSSFNELFKKHCGLTPSAYKKQQKQANKLIVKQ